MLSYGIRMIWALVILEGVVRLKILDMDHVGWKDDVLLFLRIRGMAWLISFSLLVQILSSSTSPC
jgi:hypothetical protein